MLKQRVVTATIGVLVVMGILLFGNTLAWKWLVWACSVAGFFEFAMMFRTQWYSWLSIYGALVVTGVEWFPHFFYQPSIMFLLVAIAIAIPVFSANRVELQSSALLTVGAVYLAVGGYGLGALTTLSHGWLWLWLVLISIWMSDTAAYFVGRFVGGPKLLPSVSPKKTISGAVGGAAGAAVGALVFGLITHPVHSAFAYLLFGAYVSVAGQLGDLVESAYKRSAGVKDSGKLLPGHGGMLDRIDSLLFASPFAYYLVAHGLTQWFH